ncbi:MAG: hypothetical protein M3P18_16590 [Actinomycetota bacterium]|nr:hypothetical protein [Actinomycetota bacterium]
MNERTRVQKGRYELLGAPRSRELLSLAPWRGRPNEGATRLIDPRDLVLVRIGGAAMLLFVPMLIVGVVLYGQVGMNSQSTGLEAIRKIADARPVFAIMNALFHLSPLLFVPAAAAVFIALRGQGRDGWLLMGTGFIVVTVVVGAGMTFSLNQGLLRLASGLATAAAEQQAAAAEAAEMNLGIQTGVELVQSVGIGLWLLSISIAGISAEWPAWLTYLGLASGVGMLAAGLSSILFTVPIVGPVLAGVGGLGLLLFAIWVVATGLRLLTTSAS